MGRFRSQVQHFLEGRWLHEGEEVPTSGHSGACGDRDAIGLGCAARSHRSFSKSCPIHDPAGAGCNGWRRRSHLPRPGKKMETGGYRCEAADRRADKLARTARVRSKLRPGTVLWAMMVGHLRRGLSPAQIESTLARMPDPVRLSRETIYTSLYAMPKGQLRASLLALMRRRHKTKRLQQGKNKTNNGSIPDMTLIDLRPEEINMRLISGHWEGDLFIGKVNPLKIVD